MRNTLYDKSKNKFMCKFYAEYCGVQINVQFSISTVYFTRMVYVDISWNAAKSPFSFLFYYILRNRS